MGTEGEGKGLVGRAQRGSGHGVGNEQDRLQPSGTGLAAHAAEQVWDWSVLITRGLGRMEDDRGLEVSLPHKR